MNKVDNILKSLPEDHAVVSFVDKSGREHHNITSNLSSLNLVAEVVEQIHGNVSVEYVKELDKK